MKFDVELASKTKILATQHFASLHRIRFPLHSIFFQNNSFFASNKMDTGRQGQQCCSGLTLSCRYMQRRFFRKSLFHATSTRFSSHELVNRCSFAVDEVVNKESYYCCCCCSNSKFRSYTADNPSRNSS